MSDQLYESALHILATDGNEGFKNVLVKLLNEVMKYERSSVLNAQPYERTEVREGHANGYKNKTVRTTLGKLNFDIPQVRGDVEFYPTGLEKGLRRESSQVSNGRDVYQRCLNTKSHQSL